MGVPKLFTVINKNNVTYSAIIENIKTTIDIKCMYIDFNSIIHTTSQLLISELNEMLNIIMSLKNKEEIKKHKFIQKIINKYSPHLNDLSNQFDNTAFDQISIGERFNEIFSIDNVDNLVINISIDIIHYIIKTYSKNTIDLLYIAIDGVPSKSKMVEQKQRRYMAAIISEYKNVLLKKNETVLKNSKTLYGHNRFIYEKYKMHFNKSKISPGTAFMTKLTKIYANTKFNCLKYILTSFDEIGEAEKKIIDHIKKYLYNKCLIYSPDADMILLTSLLPTSGNVILRNNQQTSTPDEPIYDLINIDVFKNNIYEYLDNRTIDKDKFIYDMICLSSMFGNDFIPKIESIDVQYNFEQLLDIYMKTFIFFNENNDDTYYLIEFNKNKNKYYLNSNFFVKFLEFYWDLELFNMKEQYMMNIYKMYKQFKTIFSTLDINKNNNSNYINHTNLNEIEQLFQLYTLKFIEIIKSISLQSSKNASDMIIDQFNQFIKKQENKFNYNYNDYTNHLKKLIKIEPFIKHVPNEINKNYQAVKKYLDNLSIDEFINFFIKVAKLEQNIVQKYKDEKFKNTSKTSKHSNAINDLGKKGESTSFDKEYYLFNNLLDTYSTILQNEPLVLVDMENNPETTIGNYYKKFFGIDQYKFTNSIHQINKSMQNDKLKHAIQKYIGGLLWTFNYYYNETNNISYWCYDEEKAPTLRDIYIYIYNNPNCLREIYNSLKIYNVTDLDNYFNPIEQLLYVTPNISDNYILIPEKYLNFFKTNEYYLDLNILVESLKDNIVCIGARFLNKCMIPKLIRYDMQYDKQFIKEIRAIKN
jgi:5'-3' exonuclease